ncbi:MAG TPA: NUDIX hydrolase [Thermoanaerobaculia bacterium]|nr:NUDIX hydrolase [Thermoanaerobaculia bacterium]
MNREDLIDALAAFEPSTPEDRDSLERLRRFVAADHDPFARANPAGHVTGSAVVARPDGSAFLLVHHKKLGRWLQPGGHTEEGDASVFDAALREVREETGIAEIAAPLGRRILDVDVHPIPAHGKDPAHSHFDVRFLVTTEREVDRGVAEDPRRPMAWRTLDEALADGVDASLERSLRKAREALKAR